jgi:putative heme-binding domain-containing protein
MNRRYVLVALTLLAFVSCRGAFAQTTRSATPADQIKLPPGFKAELLHSATEDEGSWVCMTIDDRGRLYVSAQAKQMPPKEPYEVEPMFRITLDDAGHVGKIERIPLKVGNAMGMLWAFDSLYVSGVGPEGQGIYRLFDTDKDDTLDKVTLFKSIPMGWGEHGAHAIVLGPDKMLYIANGNSTPLVEGTDVANSPHRNWKEDFLLPRIMDPVATFFDKLKVPYGCVYRVDPEGKHWELFAGGFRNEYDIDFNADGELFTYDSDMEWDIGLPWYRPTRVLHVVSGAEFGFREGSTKWPEYYADSLGSVVDIGLGSPTGVKFGTKSNFPTRYKRAMFALDWTYGRILAIHMQPGGASYLAMNKLPNRYYLEQPSSSDDVEVFLSGKGMPVNDVEFGKDGAMYVTVGGRGTQAGLYRISYVGKPETVLEKTFDDPLVALRRNLEKYHGKTDSHAVEAAWPHLGNMDRNVRYAARVAIEGQPVEEWKQRALDEKDPQAAMTALLGLARMGGKDTQEALLGALAKFPLDSLNEPLKLDKLRVIEVSFVRQGRPSQAMVDRGIEKLSKQYPATSFALNHELSQLLVRLGAKDVVGKTLSLMRKTNDPGEQIWYAYVLREANPKDWTADQRHTYFSWFNKAAGFKGGNSFPKFILAIRESALSKLSEDQKKSLADVLKAPAPQAPKPTVAAVQRQFQREWKVSDLDPDLPKASHGRNFERGKEIFASLQCAACHRFNGEGGGVGPDISAVGNRFNRHDLLDSIVEPSKVISEQYLSYVVKTKLGETVVGQIAEENNDHITIITNALTGEKKQIGQTRIAARKVSPVSPMPSNMLDVLTRDEILDLLAYIESGGKRDAKQFSAAK